VPTPGRQTFTDTRHWLSDRVSDKTVFRRGLVYRRFEDAAQAGKAMVGIDPHKDDDGES